MRPMRSSGGGFGLPQFTTVASKLAMALVAGSVIFALSGGLRGWLLLQPAMVIQQLALWQPLSYVLIEVTPIGVIFGALIVWMVGGSLEMTWGSRRLLRFALVAPVLAAVLTVLLSLVMSPLRLSTFAGGSVLTSALWVAYGLSFGRNQVNFWGIPMTGNVLALVGVGFVLLNAVFGSPWSVVPDLFGIAFAYAYVRGPTPRHALLRFQSWRFQRQLKTRSRHLRVVSEDRNMPRDSDRYLH